MLRVFKYGLSLNTVRVKGGAYGCMCSFERAEMLYIASTAIRILARRSKPMRESLSM